jgi:hypothetical protein
MRLHRLASATIVAAASLTLMAPAVAAAHRHPSPGGRCRINLNVAPREITAGDPVVAFGRLVCTRRVNAAGQTVKLFEHSLGTPGSTLVQSTSTDALGFYELTQTGVETNSAFFVRSHRAQSARRRVRVAAQVTLSGPPEGTQLLTGPANAVTFTGTVDPADVGARVILQRQNALTGNEWRRIGSGTVGPEGDFSIPHTFIVPGDANLRVLVRSRGMNIPSPSNVLTYEISQAQNPQLTIVASADPITYGQSVTISGVAAGLANTPVTLFARSASQRGFAPVAEVTTNAGGEYAFGAQSPVYNSFYQVRTGAKVSREKSAVLYEGVKDVLTAEVSPSTVQAGQALTFKGTVAPEHAGHIIYLERQNAAGSGFHVVQVATIGAGSTYTIVHTVYDAGTKVFRVRVPGDPENEGAVSAPFTIQVTPAPASALMPEAPGNSSLPAEGQTEGSQAQAPLAEWRSSAKGACGRPRGDGHSIWSRRLRRGRLVDAHHVAGRVAHGAVARAPRLVGRLLHDLGVRGAQLREGRVEVVGVEVHAVQRALREERLKRVAVGGAAVQIVRKDDCDPRLGGGADGDPAEVFAGDVVAQLEAERVAVEGQRAVGVMDEDKAGRES